MTRDNDLDAMNGQSDVYEAFYNGYFFGITITASGASGQFSNNTTLIFDDCCSGFGLRFSFPISPPTFHNPSALYKEAGYPV